jgi:hypothetical protein
MRCVQAGALYPACMSSSSPARPSPANEDPTPPKRPPPPRRAARRAPDGARAVAGRAGARPAAGAAARRAARRRGRPARRRLPLLRGLPQLRVGRAGRPPRRRGADGLQGQQARPRVGAKSLPRARGAASGAPRRAAPAGARAGLDVRKEARCRGEPPLCRAPLRPAGGGPKPAAAWRGRCRSCSRRRACAACRRAARSPSGCACTLAAW